MNSAKISRLGYLRTLGHQQNIPSSLKKASQNAKKSGSGCVTGYVNGQPNTTKCPPSDIDFGEDPDDDGGFGDTGGPQDYYDTPSDSGPSETPPKTAEDFNEEIDDSKLPDCMKQVLAELKNLNGNTVADIIKKFAGEVPAYNLNFNVENNNDYSKIARVDPQVNSNFVTIWLNINRDAIGNVTDLAVAATILHESVHAYLVASSFDDPAAMQLSYPELFDKKARLINNIQNDKQHEIMTKDFIKDIAISLKEFGVAQGYNYSTSYYDDLAWKGLYGTKAFNNLDNVSKTRIINIIKAEQYGITKQAEGITQKGQKLGC